MHLVFLNQYYPPDAAPTGVMLEALVEECVRQGHTATVICAAGGYADLKETKGHRPPLDAAVRVHRIGATRFGRGTFVGKVVDYLSYYGGLGWRLMWMKPRPERLVALTTPPYLSLLARVISKLRGADHAHWVMDLYPDVLVAHGLLKSGGLAHRALAGLARWGFGGKRCATVVTLGPCMAERVADLLGTVGNLESGAGDSPFQVSWVPLWGTAAAAVGHGVTAGELRERRGWKDGDLVVMYSGNMGLGHSFSEVLEVARRMKGTLPDGGRVRFVFFGGGKRRAEVERFAAEHAECGIEVEDYVAGADLDAHLRSADVHLTSLSGEWTGTMIPSKLQGIFAVGRPVIHVGEAGSSIARWVVESGGGWLVPPSGVQELMEAVSHAGSAARRKEMGGDARAFAEGNFDRSRNVARLAEEISKLDVDRCPERVL